jgi:hypothetical protein
LEPGIPLSKIASRLFSFTSSMYVYVPFAPVPTIRIVCGPGVLI